MATAPYHFIVNPTSGGGRTARRLEALRRAVQRHGLEATFIETAYRGHGRDLARLAIEDGATTLVACGGDGTVNEVANGILDLGAGDSVRIGTVPLGTGKDVGKCLGMPGPRAGLDAVAAGHERRIDVGLMEAVGENGEQLSRAFVLELAAGWVAEVSASVPRWLKRLGDTAPYVLMVGVKMVGPMNRTFTLEIDGQQMDGPYNTISVHNMEYWGGDLLVAPGALPDDGLFDVVRWGALGRPALLKAVDGQRKDGRHLDIDGIDFGTATKLTLDADRKTAIDLDGEAAGYLPAEITMVSRALRFLAPAVATPG